MLCPINLNPATKKGFSNFMQLKYRKEMNFEVSIKYSITENVHMKGINPLHISALNFQFQRICIICLQHKGEMRAKLKTFFILTTVFTTVSRH